jgi:hypothetical protein
VCCTDKRDPARAITTARCRVCAGIIDGVEAILKVCTVIEETLIESEIRKQTCISFIAMSSVNNDQYMFTCRSVVNT